MFEWLTSVLKPLINAWIIVGLVALWLLLAVAFQYVGDRLKKFSGGCGSLDGRFGYTPELARKMLGAYGTEGRRFYARYELTLDMVFPAVTALLTNLLLLACGPSLLDNAGFLGVLALLPFAAMLADYLENATVLLMLKRFPGDIASIARLGSIVGRAKWVLYLVPGSVAVVSLLAWVWQRWAP
ncbi:MAG: hypothetical protein M3441_01960 [Chloroflexota bacterium]|nr:hypothetical protein [Chloroflexota bacterium]